MRDEASNRIKTAYDNRPENRLPQVRRNSKKIRQIPVHFVNQPIVIPGLSRPEPLPSRSPDERADDDHRDPQNDEAEQECSNGKLALLPGVIAAA